MEYADSESSGLRSHPDYENLDRNNKLSVQMKSFSDKAQAQPQLQLSKSSLKKEEVVFTIETLVESLNEAK
ncbi:15435_t:CDS:2 [Racocetra persica]|uniref:15435_t:CDS:1 n=1 Tax=Racocetra persica TaxID=160502 RepID=A0ACA9SCT4_9GLOM|nr:15435_t:CDS:2 [Racocetra persica]